MEAQTCSFTVSNLADNVRTIVIASLPRIVGTEEEDHSACRIPSFEDAVAGIMGSIPSPVLDCHKDHMKLRSNPTKPKGKTSNEAQAGGKTSLTAESGKKAGPGRSSSGMKLKLNTQTGHSVNGSNV